MDLHFNNNKNNVFYKYFIGACYLSRTMSECKLHVCICIFDLFLNTLKKYSI